MHMNIVAGDSLTVSYVQHLKHVIQHAFSNDLGGFYTGR